MIIINAPDSLIFSETKFKPKSDSFVLTSNEINQLIHWLQFNKTGYIEKVMLNVHK